MLKPLRTTVLKVCVTERESRAYAAAADAQGMSLSTWLRVLANTAAQPQIAAMSRKRVKS